MSEWSNVPISTNIYLERVALDELPLHLGESASLDKQISEILGGQTEQLESYWLFNDEKLIGIRGTLELELKADEAELEVEGKSSGYYLPGTRTDPPEGDDEREVTKANLIFYKEGMVIGQKEMINENELAKFGDIIDNELYEIELPGW